MAFADDLRGVAVLIVFFFHVMGVFWLYHGAATHQANVPEWNGPMPRVVSNLDRLLPFLRNGQFGVALFFLISGFVIPFSLEKATRVQFLVIRAFRIWPTYAVSFGVTLLCLLGAGWYFGRPFPHTASAVLANLFLVQDVAWQPVVSGCWSLEVQIKFYVLCALLAGSIVRGRVWVVLAAAGGMALLTGFSAQWAGGLLARGEMQLYALVWTQQTSCVMFAFMFIGTLFHFHYRGKLSAGGLAGAGALLLAAFGVQYEMAIVGANGRATAVIVNYGVSLGIFSVVYALRDRIRFPRVIRFFAGISYPFYLVHGVFSYVLMRILLDVFERHHLAKPDGYHRYVAVGAALTGAVLLALALHWTVERYSNEWGRRVARRIGRRRMPPAGPGERPEGERELGREPEMVGAGAP